MASANRSLRQDAIDEVGRCIHHSPPATEGTEPAPLAREGKGPVAATGDAVDAQEAIGDHAALEIGTNLALDEASDGSTLGTRNARFEPMGNRYFKRRFPHRRY